jgi:tetratricopeptide (TPR) repeat protein
MSDSPDDIGQEIKSEGSSQIHSNNDTTFTSRDGATDTKGEIIVYQGIDPKEFAQLLAEKQRLEEKLAQLAKENDKLRQQQIALDATEIAEEMQQNKNIEFDPWKLIEIGSAAELGGQLERAEEYYEQAQRKFKLVDDKNGEALSLAHLSVIAVDFREMERLYCECLAIEKEIGNRREVAKTLRDVLITMANFWADGDEVERLNREALASSIQIGDRKGEAVSLNNLGNVARSGGDLDEAERLYQESLAIMKEIGDRREEAITLGNLASMARQEREDFDKAEQLYRECLAIQREICDREGELDSLGELRSIAYTREQIQLGNYLTKERRREHRDLEAKKLAEEMEHIQNKEFDPWKLIHMGDALRDALKSDYAWGYYTEAQRKFKSEGDREGEAVSLNSLGIMARRNGKDAEAERLHRASLAIHREIGNRRGEASSLDNLGEIAISRGDLDETERLYRESMAIMKEIGDRQGEADSLNALAELFYNYRRDEQEAERLFRDHLFIVRQIGDRKGEASSLWNLKVFEKMRGNLDETERLVRESLVIQREIGDRYREADSLRYLGMIAKSQGDEAAANNLFKEAIEIWNELGEPLDEEDILGYYSTNWHLI